MEGAQVAAVKIKKPQAFSRCGSPGSKIYCYEILPSPDQRS
jgi:hypothetical protein